MARPAPRYGDALVRDVRASEPSWCGVFGVSASAHGEDTCARSFRATESREGVMPDDVPDVDQPRPTRRSSLIRARRTRPRKRSGTAWAGPHARPAPQKTLRGRDTRSPARTPRAGRRPARRARIVRFASVAVLRRRRCGVIAAIGRRGSFPVQKRRANVTTPRSSATSAKGAEDAAREAGLVAECGLAPRVSCV
jgi:hypothetical protein